MILKIKVSYNYKPSPAVYNVDLITIQSANIARGYPCRFRHCLDISLSGHKLESPKKGSLIFSFFELILK